MATIRVVVGIEKSFDDGKQLAKTWETGDMKEFFTGEGEYLDRLCKTLDVHGKQDEGFKVTYTVVATKED